MEDFLLYNRVSKLEGKTSTIFDLENDEKWVYGYYGLYSVTEDGRVFSYVKGYKKELSRCLETNHRNGEKTYYIVHLKGKTKKVHRLVAEAFLDEPSEDLLEFARNSFHGKVHVNHKDLDKRNNHYTNLEWCTPSQNARHAHENNAMDYNKPYKKEQADNFVLTGELGVRKKRAATYSLKPEDFIRNNIPAEIKDIGYNSYPLHRWNRIIDTFELCETDLLLEEIADLLGIDITTVSKIKNGHRQSAAKEIYEKYGNDPYYRVNYERTYTLNQQMSGMLDQIQKLKNIAKQNEERVDD